MITASNDDTLNIYDTAEGKRLFSVPSHKYGAQNVVWTHSPQRVIIASNKVSAAASPPSVNSLTAHIAWYPIMQQQSGINSSCNGSPHDRLGNLKQPPVVASEVQPVAGTLTFTML